MAIKGGPQIETVTGHAILGDDAETAIIDLDMLVLSRAWQDLVALDKQGLRVLLACPVHYRTLVRGTTAERYRSLCQTIPEELRQYIIFEVTGLEAGAPQSLIQDVTSSLWSSGRSIIAQLDGRHSSFENCRGSRLHAVGADMSACQGSEAEIMSMLDQFVAGAREADLSTYIHGLPSLSLAMAAVCAGFDYIAGDAINEPVQFPRYIYRFGSEDLVTGFLADDRHN